MSFRKEVINNTKKLLWVSFITIISVFVILVLCGTTILDFILMPLFFIIGFILDKNLLFSISYMYMEYFINPLFCIFKIFEDKYI